MNPLRDFADTWFPSLLSHLWSSSIFLLLMLLVVFASRNHLTASGRFSLALIGIVKFAIPAALVMPAVEFFSTGSPRAFPIPLQALGGALRIDSSVMALGVWPAIAIALWLAVAAMLIVRFALTRHRLVALSVRTALPAKPREVEALRRAQRRVGVERGIDIARAAFPEAPAVLRVFRPLVVLPLDGCGDLSDDELESLLCHECAHVARQDNLVARIESFICALFWFHPLIWIAQRITVIERERACDEVVAESADERNTYLTALTKFCHSAIAPRLPGVSCMATAKLKERMDYVMNYSDLKAQAPSARRLTLLASAGLVLFTLAAGIVGSERAFATTKSDQYAVRITATRSEESITVQGSVSENKTQKVIAAPKVSFSAGQRATSKSSTDGLEIVFDVRPASEDRVAVDVTIEKNGKVIQQHSLVVSPTLEEGTETPARYSGAPIDLVLEDADLRNVIGTFGKITGLEIRMDDSVQGKVSVNWHGVPWDEAFDTVLNDNGLTYRIEGKTIHVTKK